MLILSLNFPGSQDGKKGDYTLHKKKKISNLAERSSISKFQNE